MGEFVFEDILSLFSIYSEFIHWINRPVPTVWRLWFNVEVQSVLLMALPLFFYLGQRGHATQLVVLTCHQLFVTRFVCQKLFMQASLTSWACHTLVMHTCTACYLQVHHMYIMHTSPYIASTLAPLLKDSAMDSFIIICMLLFWYFSLSSLALFLHTYDRPHWPDATFKEQTAGLSIKAWDVCTEGSSHVCK